jgi:TPR repeat protein
MKDKAFAVSSEEFVESPNFLQNYFLVKEIFDMHLSSFGGKKYTKKSQENIEMILKKSEKGDQQASLQLGYMYYYGFYGQKIDFSKAFSYFYQAMLRGDSTGEAFVGYMYYQGIGIEKNLKKAFQIFQTGVVKKNYKCYNGLGLMHLRGDHLAKNLTEAYRLFKGRLI